MKTPPIYFSIVYDKQLNRRDCYIDLHQPDKQWYRCQTTIKGVITDIYVHETGLGLDSDTIVTIHPHKQVCLGAVLNEASKQIANWINCH